MDIAAFKVRHSVGMDIDTTALRAARSRSSSIGAMDESSKNVQTVPPNGAIEEMSLTVQNASAHTGAHIGASTAPVGLLGASRTVVIALPAEDK